VEAGDGWQGGALRGFGCGSFLIYGMDYGLMSGRTETESNFHFNLGEVESWSLGGNGVSWG
jgi:hypothetical protein